jgi:CTP:molybdopterin cytidylyltransferase MocA
MTSTSQLCGLILAAGESSRMGTDKALLPWPPPSRVPQVSILRPGIPQPSAPSAAPLAKQTLLSAGILAVQSLTQAVIVVAGRNADSLTPIVDANGAILVRNPAPERGQFSSLQTGLRELLARGYHAAMITPVDCPPLRSASLELLIAGFVRALARDLWAVAPENNGKHGHPLLVNRDLIEAFLTAPVTSNAREVLHANAHRIEYIPVPDTLAKAGLNTPQDYADRGAKIARQ